jgi:hypothetical protein
MANRNLSAEELKRANELLLELRKRLTGTPPARGNYANALVFGAPEGIRTPDLCLRRAMNT